RGKAGGLEEFHPDRLASRILGMGDVLTLIERAEALDIEEAEAEEMQRKLLDASFTLEDFRKQLKQMKKLGPLTQILELAGMGQVANALPQEQVDRQLRVFEAIMNSMTPEERERPRLLNANRRRRIAVGSGTSVQEVNQLIKQFQSTQRMMKKLSKQKLTGSPSDFRGLFK